MIATFFATLAVIAYLVLLAALLIVGAWRYLQASDAPVGARAPYVLRGVLTHIVLVVLIAAGVAFTTAGDDQGPCVISHVVWIKGQQYSVCDEHATPINKENSR